LTETFDLDDWDRLRLPAFPLEMDIRVLEVREARRVVFETVEKGPLQDPQIDLLFGEKLLGFQTLVPRISREGLEVPFDETPPRLELEESSHGSLEFLDGRLAFFPAAPGGDELSRDEREPVGNDLLPGEDVEDEQLLRSRVDFDRLVLVPGGELIVTGLNRDQGFIVGRPFLSAEQRVFPENRVPQRPQMGPFLVDEDGRDLLSRLGDLAVGPPRQPVQDSGVGLLHPLEVPARQEIPFDEFNQVLDLTLRFGIRPPTDVEPELLFIDKVFKIFSIDDVSGVLADHHQPVLVDHQLLRPAPEIVETVQKMTDDIQGPKRLPLKNHILVAAGRKHRGEDVENQAAAASVLAEIELHLLAEGQFGDFAVQPDGVVQSQAFRLEEIGDVVAKRLFIPRQRAVSLLQIVVNRRNRQRPEVIRPVNLEDLALPVVERLVPEKMILAVRPVVLFPHGEVFGHGSGIDFQGSPDRALGKSLPFKCLNLLEHRFVDHPASCKVSFYLTGVRYGISIYRAYGISVYRDPCISIYHDPRISAYHFQKAGLPRNGTA